MSSTIDTSELTPFRRGAILVSNMFTVTLYFTTILVVSTVLPQIQGAMSATPDEVSWIVTFNILAIAIATPMAAIAHREGRLFDPGPRSPARFCRCRGCARTTISSVRVSRPPARATSPLRRGKPGLPLGVRSEHRFAAHEVVQIPRHNRTRGAADEVRRTDDTHVCAHPEPALPRAQLVEHQITWQDPLVLLKIRPELIVVVVPGGSRNHTLIQEDGQRLKRPISDLANAGGDHTQRHTSPFGGVGD